MARRVIEMMDDMHLSSQDIFLDYYYAMQSNNVSDANAILENNPLVANQIMNESTINTLLNETYRRELVPKTDIDYYLAGLHSVFEKMILDTRVRGYWDSETQYYVHNFVYYNEKGYYVYTNTTPPIGTLPTDTTYWLEYDIKGFQGYGGLDLNFKFNWNNTQNYVIGDVVIYQNKMWYAIANNINYEPNLNHYPWVIISTPKIAQKTPIQKSTPSGYDIGNFWFEITQGDEVIITKWGNIQSEPTPRFASGAFSIGNNIYIVSGIKSNFVQTNLNEMFDTVTGTWSVKASPTLTRARVASFSIGTKGYIVGGIDDGTIIATNEIYDSETNTWSTGTDYPLPIISSGTSANDIGYIISGETTNNVITSNSYSYNPISDSWTLISNKITPTYGHSVCTDGTSVFAIGGINIDGQTLGINESYNISSNMWESKDVLSVPRSYLASFVQGGIIYAVGGLNSNWYSLDTNEKYNIENNMWETDMPLNYPRSSLNALVSGTRGFAIGGIDISSSSVKGYNEQYNINDLPSDFEILIDTTLDSSGSKNISIPMVNGGTYSYWIDWGDGLTSPTITSYNDANASHTYLEDGEYTIKLSGTLNQLQFTGNIAKCLKEVNKCNLNLLSIDNMFKNCINLTYIIDGIFNQSLNITSAISTFEGCLSLQILPIGLFDNNISITSFSNTFKNSGITTIPTGLFNANNLVTSFNSTFAECSSLVSLAQGLFNNNANTNSFYGTFMNCTQITSIPNNFLINNPVVSTYESMFNGCISLTSLPSNLIGNSASTATNYSYMFNNCPLTDIPNGIFEHASNSTNFNNIFNGSSITSIPNNCFNGNNATWTNAFPINSITNLEDNSLNGLAITSDMFKNKTSLITVGNDVFWSNLDTTLYSNPTEMFSGATNLTTIGNINLKGIPSSIDLTTMFLNCDSLENISGFLYNNEPSISSNIDFSNCPLTHNSLINISNSLITNTPTTIKNLTLGSSNLSKMTDVEKLVIINKYWNLVGYDISITSQIAQDIILELEGWSGLSTEMYQETSLYFYIRLYDSSTSYNYGYYAVDKNSGYIYEYDNIPEYEYYTIMFTESSEEGVENWIPKGTGNDIDGSLLKSNINSINIQTPISELVVGINSVNVLNTGLDNIQNGSYLFAGLSNLTSITINSSENSKVSNLSYMFDSCDSLENINMNNFDISNVTNTSYMFKDCSALTSMPAINMINVVNASYMFVNSGLTSITGNILGTNIQNAEGMFKNCDSLTTLPTTYTTVFRTNPNLTNVSHLFENCTSLTNVGIHNVFYLDESGMAPEYLIDNTKINNQIFRNCPNITDMSYMLKGCTQLGTTIGNLGIPMALFYYCSNLTNISHVFDGCQHIEVNSGLAGLGITVNSVLFVNNSELVDVSYAFANSKTDFIGENTSNPTLLFPVQTKIENASYLWFNCEMTQAQGYEEIPFIYKSTVLKNIEGMFMGQTFSRSLPDMTSSSISAEYNWKNINIFCPILENCSKMFSGNIGLLDSSNGLATTFITALNSIASLSNHSETFKDCTALSDYAAIPIGWK